MKKEYTSPELDVTEMSASDVVTTSPWTLPEVGINW